MHRDVKVGLSLGILLVGIVGALFLRREPEKREEGVPQLQNPQKLDEAIAGKQNIPHLTGVDDSGDDPAPPPSKKGTGDAKTQAAKGAYQVPEFLTAEDAETQRKVLNGGNTTAPDPIQPPSSKGNGGKKELVATPPAPAHNGDWETPGSQKSKTAKGSEMLAKDASKSTDGVQKHVIQPGDTLSGIASHYLGSSARFKEIYDANRTVLRSPNDLPEGATLVIPGGSTDSKTVAKPVKRTSESAAVTTEEPAAGPLRFQPVNRTPFNLGRALRTGATPPARSQTKEKLPSIEVDDEQ